MRPRRGRGTITFDLSGASEVSFPSGSIPLGAGSSLTLELDANGDGTPGDVTIAASQLLFDGLLEFGSLGSFEIHGVGTLSGGLGSLAGPIEWTAPASYSAEDTVRCFGAICGLPGLIRGAVPRRARGAGAGSRGAARRRARAERGPTLLALGVGLALLAVASSAGAATITYDLAGTSIFRRVTAFSPTGYLDTPLAAGSTLVLDLDPNGDGLQHDATIVSSEMHVHEILQGFGTSEFAFTLYIDWEIELTGGEGRVVPGPFGSEPLIDWGYYAPSPYVPGQLSASASFHCEGPGCSIPLGIQEGETYSYEDSPVFNDVLLSEGGLGLWVVDPGPGGVLLTGCIDYFGGCNHFSAVSEHHDGTPSTGFRLHGRRVPEPGSAALSIGVALVLGLRRFA